jgi:hypothetical protein
MQSRLTWTAAFLVPQVLAGCGAAVDPDPFQDGSAAGGGGAEPGASQTSSAGQGAPSQPAPRDPGAATAPATEAVTQLPLSAPAPAPAAPAVLAPPLSAAADPSACVSYETGFVPLVYQPVCSNCHATGAGLPRFEPYAQARARCAQIGREVASGDMPPSGGLSAEQRAVVARWVALSCPETAADAAASCAQPGNDPGPVAAPPPAGRTGDADDDDDDGDGDDDDDRDDDGDDDD